MARVAMVIRIVFAWKVESLEFVRYKRVETICNECVGTRINTGY